MLLYSKSRYRSVVLIFIEHDQNYSLLATDSLMQHFEHAEMEVEGEDVTPARDSFIGRKLRFTILDTVVPGGVIETEVVALALQNCRLNCSRLSIPLI